jgi:hypothetical protein
MPCGVGTPIQYRVYHRVLGRTKSLIFMKKRSLEGDEQSGNDLCSPGKLPVLRCYFDLFSFFNERGNADLQAGLEPG